MIGALALTVLLSCNAYDQGENTIIPQLRWDGSPDAVGYEIDWRAAEYGTTAEFTPGDVVACSFSDEGVKTCPGVDFPYSAHAGTRLLAFDFRPGVLYEFCVKAISAAGIRSATCSNSIFICWPPTALW